MPGSEALTLHWKNDYTLVFRCYSGNASLAIAGTPTGGSFTLSYLGSTTSSLNYNASAANVQAALAALDTIPQGAVTCTGGALPGTPIVIAFGGLLADADPRDIAVASAALTGGTSPEVEVSGELETLSGYSALTFTIKLGYGDADAAAVVQKTLGAGVSVTGTGICQVVLQDTDLDDLALKSQGYRLVGDLTGVDSTGARHTLWLGEVRLLPVVTRT